MTNNKTQLYQKRDFGEVLNAAFNFLRNNAKNFFKVLLAVAGPFILIYLVYSAYFTSQFANQEFFEGGASQFSSLNLISYLFLWLMTASIATVVYAYLKLYNQSDDGQVSIADAWSVFGSAIFPILLATVLLGLGIVVGFLVLIIPGLYFLTRWSMVLPILIFDRGDVLSAFARSNYLVKDNSWPSFGMLIVLTLISYLISIVLTLPAAILFGVEAFTQLEAQELNTEKLFGWKFTLMAIFSTLGQILGYVVVYLGLGFQYFNLVENKESRGLMSEIDAVAENKEDEANIGTY